jgi:hypothetical protein
MIHMTFLSICAPALFYPEDIGGMHPLRGGREFDLRVPRRRAEQAAATVNTSGEAEMGAARSVSYLLSAGIPANEW